MFGVIRNTAKIITLSSLLCGAASLTYAETKLRIAGQHPIDHNATQVLKNVEKQVEAANVGLNVKLYPAAQLGTGEQVFGDVARGNIDIGHTFIYSHNDPMLEINSIPYLVSDYDQMRKVFSPGSNFYSTYESLLDKQNVKLLGIYAEGFIGVGTNQMPENARQPGDKKLNIRVWSASVAKETASDLGYRTTTIDWGDTFTALQTGVTDGLIGANPEGAYTTFADALKFYIPYNAFVEHTMFYMNKKKWQKLTPEQQQALSTAFTAASQRSFEISQASDAEFLSRMADEKGIEIVELNNQQRAAIADHIRTETWPKLADKFGQELLSKLQQDVN